MAQRVTLAIPNPENPAVDINIGTAANPLVTSGGGGSAAAPSVAGGEYNSPVPTLTIGQTDALQLDQNANLRVAIQAFPVVAADNISNGNLGSVGSSAASSTTSRPLLVSGTVFNGTTWDRARGDTNGTFTVAKGSAAMATNQVSVATTSTLIVAARTGRSSVTITNLGATDIFIGNTGVSLTTGTLLVGTKGAAITIPTSAAIYGIASVAQSVSFIENY